MAEANLCVTGGERHVAELASRLRATQLAGLLQEVRLDLLERLDDETFALLASPRIVVTCRGAAEGGGWRGDERERRQILLRALEQRPGFLDVELSAPIELRRELLERRGDTRVIVSAHLFAAGAGAAAPLPSGASSRGEDPPRTPPQATDHSRTIAVDRAASWENLARQLAQEPADLLKLAVAVDDPADLRVLCGLLRDEQRPVLRVGMGEAGLLSRALPGRFGSPWSYVVLDGADPVAPGQLALAQARAWRVPEEQHLQPLALLGGPAISRSPGPSVYNRLFIARSLPFLYLPVATTRPAQTLELCIDLGFAGFSVTMPAKEILAPLMEELHPEAHAIGAINTVELRRGRRVGINTDVTAVRELCVAAAGHVALVLGAGGAGRAAICALRWLGCAVHVTDPDAPRAGRLAKELGVAVVPWEERAAVPFAALVNATPCGDDGQSDPMPAVADWAGRIVLDMVLTPPSAPTPLVQRVAAAGGNALPGLRMWAMQGAQQMSALIGQAISVAELEELLHA